jgi:ubiquinol-cytochrome c reductase iron-sulfur subunit
MSDSSPPDSKTRRDLLIATSVVGAAGTVYTLVPFVASLNPSERAKAAGAPVEVDVSTLEAGGIKTVEWRGKPVWIVNRTEEMIAGLDKHNDLLADPASEVEMQPGYAKNSARSLDKKALLVVEGVCTHLGCSPTFRKEVAPVDLGAEWPGGFYCPCHGSKFDLAGRVFKGVPAPINLRVPPYKYLADGKILIGADSEEKKA